jgi:hypothetical protein
MKLHRKNVVTNRKTIERAVALAIYLVCTHNVRLQTVMMLVGQKFVLTNILTVHGRLHLSARTRHQLHVLLNITDFNVNEGLVVCRITNFNTHAYCNNCTYAEFKRDINITHL